MEKENDMEGMGCIYICVCVKAIKIKYIGISKESNLDRLEQVFTQGHA